MELSSWSLSSGDNALGLLLPFCSRTRGVSAPLFRIREAYSGETGKAEPDKSEEMLPGLLDPWVATMEGDDGGSGERVK